jgi:hypothetical protein
MLQVRLLGGELHHPAELDPARELLNGFVVQLDVRTPPAQANSRTLLCPPVNLCVPYCETLLLNGFVVQLDVRTPPLHKPTAEPYCALLSTYVYPTVKPSCSTASSCSWTCAPPLHKLTA